MCTVRIGGSTNCSMDQFRSKTRNAKVKKIKQEENLLYDNKTFANLFHKPLDNGLWEQNQALHS